MMMVLIFEYVCVVWLDAARVGKLQASRNVPRRRRLAVFFNRSGPVNSRHLFSARKMQPLASQ
jgi:hypothetical protein